MHAYDTGLDVLGMGDVIFGMFDLQNVQRNLTSLKPVTVGIARVLVRTGLEVIGKAIEGAKQPWYKSDLPGETERASVQGHLQWHANKTLTGEENAFYAPGEDLKKYVVMAFVDANAVEEGAAYLDAAWNQMWAEIQTKLAAIPRETAKMLASATSGTVEAVTGVPMWAWIAGGVAVVGLVGYGLYKVASSPAGAAVAGVAARRYLP